MMMKSESTTSLVMDREELEAFIRSVVREEVKRLLQTPPVSILDDWSQEGPENPAEDEKLLQEAMSVLEKYQDDDQAWMSWEDFEKELAQMDEES